LLVVVASRSRCAEAEFFSLIQHPENFMENMVKQGSDVAVKILRKILGHKLLEKHEDFKSAGIQYSDLAPLLNSLDSVKKLQTALSDPDGFLRQAFHEHQHQVTLETRI
jgi:hypothetical protein